MREGIFSMLINVSRLWLCRHIILCRLADHPDAIIVLVGHIFTPS